MDIRFLIDLFLNLFLVIGGGYFLIKLFRWARNKTLQNNGLIPLWVLSLLFTVYLLVSLFFLAISSLGWTMVFVLSFAIPILGGLWIVSLVAVGALLLAGYRRASVSAHSLYMLLAVQCVSILLSAGDGGDGELQGSPVFIDRILGINFLVEILPGEVLFVVVFATKVLYAILLVWFVIETLRSAVRPHEGTQERVGGEVKT